MNSSPNTARRLPPTPPALSSIDWKPRPTTTTRTSAPPLGVASDAVVAAGCQLTSVPTLGGGRIKLKISHLQESARIIDFRDSPCDASCEKRPQDASQNFNRPSQPVEKERLTTA